MLALRGLGLHQRHHPCLCFPAHLPTPSNEASLRLSQRPRKRSGPLRLEKKATVKKQAININVPGKGEERKDVGCPERMTPYGFDVFLSTGWEQHGEYRITRRRERRWRWPGSI